MHEVLVNRLGGLSLPRKSVVRLTDRPDMTLDVYRGRTTTIQYNTIQMFGKTDCTTKIYDNLIQEYTNIYIEALDITTGFPKKTQAGPLNRIVILRRAQ